MRRARDRRGPRRAYDSCSPTPRPFLQVVQGGDLALVSRDRETVPIEARLPRRLASNQAHVGLRLVGHGTTVDGEGVGGPVAEDQRPPRPLRPVRRRGVRRQAVHEDGRAGAALRQHRLRLVHRLGDSALEVPVPGVLQQHRVVAARQQLQGAVVAAGLVQVEQHRQAVAIRQRVVCQVLVPLDHGADLGRLHVQLAVVEHQVRPAQLLDHVHQAIQLREGAGHRIVGARLVQAAHRRALRRLVGLHLQARGVVAPPGDAGADRVGLAQQAVHLGLRQESLADREPVAAVGGDPCFRQHRSDSARPAW